jgi:hypothetical protein
VLLLRFDYLLSSLTSKDEYERCSLLLNELTEKKKKLSFGVVRSTDAQFSSNVMLIKFEEERTRKNCKTLSSFSSSSHYRLHLHAYIDDEKMDINMKEIAKREREREKSWRRHNITTAHI